MIAFYNFCGHEINGMLLYCIQNFQCCRSSSMNAYSRKQLPGELTESGQQTGFLIGPHIFLKSRDTYLFPSFPLCLKFRVIGTYIISQSAINKSRKVIYFSWSFSWCGEDNEGARRHASDAGGSSNIWWNRSGTKSWELTHLCLYFLDRIHYPIKYLNWAPLGTQMYDDAHHANYAGEHNFHHFRHCARYSCQWRINVRFSVPESWCKFILRGFVSFFMPSCSQNQQRARVCGTCSCKHSICLEARKLSKGNLPCVFRHVPCVGQYGH